MTISLDQKREELLEKYMTEFNLWEDDLKMLDQDLQSYGTLVEQQTREKVIEDVLTLLDKLELKEAEIYQSGSTPSSYLSNWRHIRNSITEQLRSKPQLDRDEEATKSDLLPFKHGDEGTHFACKEMSDKYGGKVGCCGCNKHNCKTDKDKP